MKHSFLLMVMLTLLILILPLTEAANATLVYISGSGTCGGTVNYYNCPKVRFFNSTGYGQFSNETELPTAGSPIIGVVIRFSNLTAKRIIITQSRDLNLDAYVSYNNTDWTVTNNIANTSRTWTARPFDLAFETKTGNAMLVYSPLDYSDGCDLAYKILLNNDTNWGNAAGGCINDTTPAGAAGTRRDLNYSWVHMDANPLATSQELVMAGFDMNNSDTVAYIWNGTVWGHLAEFTSAPSTTTGQGFDVRYAADGSKAMAATGTGANGEINTTYWNGYKWTYNPLVNLVAGTDDVAYLNLKADPLTDDLQVITNSNVNEISTSYWNGANWKTPRAPHLAMDTTATRGGDFAWNGTSSTGTVVLDADTTANKLQNASCTPECFTNTTSTIATISAPNGGAWLSLYTVPQDSLNNATILGIRTNSSGVGPSNASIIVFAQYTNGSFLQINDTSLPKPGYISINTTVIASGSEPYFLAFEKATGNLSVPPLVNVVQSLPAKLLNNSLLNVTANISPFFTDTNNQIATVLSKIYAPNGSLYLTLTMTNGSTATFQNATEKFTALPFGSWLVSIYANNSRGTLNYTENTTFAPFVQVNQSKTITIDGSFGDWDAIINTSDPVHEQLAIHRPLNGTLSGVTGNASFDRLLNDTTTFYKPSGAVNFTYLLSPNATRGTLYVSAWNLTNSTGSANVTVWNFTNGQEYNWYTLNRTEKPQNLTISTDNGLINTSGRVILQIKPITAPTVINITDTYISLPGKTYDYKGVTAPSVYLNASAGEGVTACSTGSDAYCGTLVSELTTAQYQAIEQENSTVFTQSNPDTIALKVFHFNLTEKAEELRGFTLRWVGYAGAVVGVYIFDVTNNTWYKITSQSLTSTTLPTPYVYNILNNVNRYVNSTKGLVHVLLETSAFALSTDYVSLSTNPKTHYDLSEVRLANNDTHLFAYMKTTGGIDFHLPNQYYRLFISTNETGPNSTTPDTHKPLPFNYSYRIQINNTACTIFNNSNATLSGCTFNNDSDEIELQAPLTSIDLAVNQNINATFETSSATERYDTAPDHASFLSYTLNGTAATPNVNLVQVLPAKVLNNSFVNITANVTCSCTIDTVEAWIYQPNGSLLVRSPMVNGSDTIYQNTTANLTIPPYGTYSITIRANSTVATVNNSENVTYQPFRPLNQSKTITIDGNFGDWDEITNTTDPLADNVGPVAEQLATHRPWNYSSTIGDRAFDKLPNDTTTSDDYTSESVFSQSNYTYALPSQATTGTLYATYKFSSNNALDTISLNVYNWSSNSYWTFTTCVPTTCVDTRNTTVSKSSGTINSTGGVIVRTNVTGAGTWLAQINDTYISIAGNTYDFRGISSPSQPMNASNGSVAAGSVCANNPDPYCGTTLQEFATKEYHAVALENTTTMTQAVGVVGQSATKIFHFNISENKNDVQELTFRWVGSWSGNQDLLIGFYNYGTSAWDQVFSMSADSTVKPRIINVTNATDYINDGKFVHVLLQASATGVADLITDYVSLSTLAKPTRDFDFNLVKVTNNNTHLFAYMKLNGSVNFNNASRYYRLYLSTTESGPNSTTPDTHKPLPFNYSYRIQINNTACTIFNNSNATLSGCTFNNDSDEIELQAPLTSIDLAVNQNINATFETSSATEQYDTAPDHASFLNFYLNGTGPTPAPTCDKPAGGDWNVNSTQICIDQIINLTGNLTINGTGNLTLHNVTLILNTTYNGSNMINASGYFTVNQSNLTNINFSNTNYLTNQYVFRVFVGNSGPDISRALTVINSKISRAGWADALGQRGLEINNSPSNFSNNTLVDNFIGLVLYDQVSTIRETTSSANLYGIYLLGNSHTLTHVVGNTSANNGIRIETSNNVLNNATGISSSGNAIQILNSGTNNILTNSFAHSSSGIGLYLSSGNSQNITHTKGNSTTGPGIQVDTNNNQLYNVTGLSNTSNGILLASTATGNQLNSSFAISTSHTALYLTSSANGNLLWNTTGNSTTGPGIAIEANHSTYWNVTGFSNTSTGILFNSTAFNNTLNYTYAHSETGTGMYLSQDARNNNISHSTGNSTRGAGVRVDSRNNTFINLTALTQWGQAVYVSFANTTTVYNLTARAPVGTGIFLTYSNNITVIGGSINASNGFNFTDTSNDNTFTDVNLTNASASLDIFYRSTGSGLNVNITFLNVTFRKSNVTYSCTGSCTINVKWWLNLNVSATNQTTRVTGANVNISDVNRALQYSGTTDSNGKIPVQNLTEYVQTASSTTTFTNYTLNASLPNYGFAPTNQTLNLTASMYAFLTIAPFYILSQDSSRINRTQNFIGWSTSDVGNSTIRYGLYNGSNLNETYANASYATFRNFSLTGLAPNQTYYYNISSCTTDFLCVINGTFTFNTLNNSAPGNVTLNYPTSGDTTFTNRTPHFNWTNYTNPLDPDYDSVRFHFQLCLDEPCSTLIEDNTSILNNVYSRSGELDFTTYYWRVQVNDSYGTLGNWSNASNFTLVKSVDINLTTNETVFGPMNLSEINDTSDNTPPPFIVENIGNFEVNLSINSTPLWKTVGMNTSNYMYKANDTAGCTACFNKTNSITSYTNMSSAFLIMFLDELNHTTGKSKAAVDINVTVPVNEPPGEVTGSVLLQAVNS